MKQKKNKTQDLDFQMQFYEGILNKNPDFAEALIVIGEIYTKKGLYEKGLQVDRRLSGLRPQDPIINYNLACSLSLVGDIVSALETLKRAIELGYSDISFMNNDPDLFNVRKDERFKALIENIKKVPLDIKNAK